MVDESHHGQAVTFRETIEYFKPKGLIGLTATPNRMDGKDIRELFGDEKDPLSLEEAIAKRYVTDVSYKLMTVGTLSKAALKKAIKKIIDEGQRFSMNQLNQTIFIEKRDQEIAESILSHKGKGIVFCQSILHAEEFSKYLPGSVTYHSNLKKEDLRSRLQEFKVGKTRFLLVVDKFKEGVDIPDAELIVFLRATDSMTVFLQQLGRGLRLDPLKKHVLVLDFVSNIERVEYVWRMKDKIESFLPEGDTDLNKEIWKIEGAGIDFSITEEIIDLLEVLERINTPFYKTLAEASAAAKALGFRMVEEYKLGYKQDPRLPSNPAKIYADEWISWPHFLGTEKYKTLAEASTAAKALGLKTGPEYKLGYKQDPRLRASPHKVYANEWISWPHFLGIEKYKTLSKASAVAKALGFRTQKEYRRGYKQDPRLPSSPYTFYANEWISWNHFLGTEKYKTPAEASVAAKAIGFRTGEEYLRGYKQDPRLPSSPYTFYANEWISWPHFLGIEKYKTLSKASAVAKALGFRTQKEYKRGYKQDPRLPSAPNGVYTNDWISWSHFLGKKK